MSGGFGGGTWLAGGLAGACSKGFVVYCASAEITVKKKIEITIQPTKVRDIKSSWKRNGLRKTHIASTGIL
jgi:hypothetical protein